LRRPSPPRTPPTTPMLEGSRIGHDGGVESVARKSLAERLAGLEALDSLAEPLQQVVKAAVPEGSGLKDALSGTWLGHPLHPPLTDVVVGAWTSALLLDLLGGDDAGAAADT